MSRRILIPLLGLALLFPVHLILNAQEGKSKDPENRYALNLRARKASEADFGKDTRVYGIEVYTDGPSGDGLLLVETGSLAAVPAKLFKTPEGKVKDPLFRYGLNLKSRPGGEKDWEKSKQFGLEVFRDDNNGNLLYITEAGTLAVVPSKYADDAAPAKPKNPKWMHDMDLKVRKAGEKDFDKDTRKFGVEVFRDENTNNWIYITETGGLAVVPGKLTKEEKSKGPDWQHGLELPVRKVGETDFTKDTKKFGIEVFLDSANGNILYICETGAIAVVPAQFARKTTGPSKGPDLKHAMDLAVRKSTEKDFNKETRRFGVEVYLDENNGTMLYLTETGNLAVVSRSSE